MPRIQITHKLRWLKSRFIFNPHSGHNARNPHLLERVRSFIAEHHLDARVDLTEYPNHATELARRAIDEGCERVIAVGGDGTVNEIAAALVGTSLTFGLVPCGSGNGLGRYLGIPGPGRQAFRTLLNGRIRSIDTGLVNGHPFFNAMGVGFDAELGSRFNRLTRRGLAAYIRTARRTLFDYRPETYLIRYGNETLNTRALLIAVANSDQYGNNCFIAPGASIDDGRLDLTVLNPPNLICALGLLPRLFLRRIDGSRSVRRLRGAHFTIERPFPGLMHTDGEIHPAGTTLEIVVRPRSLRVLVPAEVP